MTRWVGRAALCIGLIVAGCASGQNTLAGLDAEALYQRGTEAAENRKWDNAIAAFEQLMFQFPTHPRTQDARFRLGDVYYQRKQYLTAATEFARLADDYPTGQYADDARFRVCEAYARQSPRPPLDQEYTRSAIGHCRFLVATFPQSEYVTRAEEIIKNMRNKLAEKELRASGVYMKMQAYDSAILTLTDMLEQFPDANAVPQALLTLFRAYEKIGYREEADATRERLLKDFPDSPEARQVREVTVETNR